MYFLVTDCFSMCLSVCHGKTLYWFTVSNVHFRMLIDKQLKVVY